MATIPNFDQVQLGVPFGQGLTGYLLKWVCLLLFRFPAAPELVAGLPVSVTAVSGDQVNFTCTGDSIPAPEVEWKKDNRTLNQSITWPSGEFQVTSQLVIDHVKYAGRGDYTCVIRNYRGEASSTVHLTVNGRPHYFQKTVVWPFHSQEWSISIFPFSLSRSITSPGMQNLAFHIAYSDERLNYQFSPSHTYIPLFKGWENVLFELGSKRVNTVK